METDILFVPGFALRQKSVNQRKGYLEKANETFELYGRHIVGSSIYGMVPTKEALSVYVKRLIDEVAYLKPRAVVGHSMGGLIMLDAFQRLNYKCPLIALEAPFGGMKIWQLALLLYRYPSTRRCVRDMWGLSDFMYRLSLKNMGMPILQVQGRFSQMGLAKNVFLNLPEAEVVVLPGIEHSGMIASQEVQKVIMEFLKKIERTEKSSSL